MKKVNFLKLGVLLFGVSLFMWNCEKEEIIESNLQISNNNVKNKTIENLSLSQLDNEPLFNEVASLFKIKSILKKSKAKKGKFLKKAEQGFHIGTNDVIKIEKKDYTSYTFLVDRGNNEQHKIENLVIEKKQDTIRGFFIKYIFSQRYMDSIYKNVQIPFDGIIERTPYKDNINDLLESLKNSVDTSNLLPKSNSRTICFDTDVTIKVKCRSGKHSVGEACSLSGDQRAYSYTISITRCISNRGGGGGGVSSGYSGLGSISTDSSSGGGGDGSTGGSHTSPNIPCDDIIHGCDKVVDRLDSRLGLDENQTNWIRNEENLNLIEDFLDENPNSTEAESFAKLAIEALINRGKVDFDDRLVYNPGLDQDYLSMMSQQEKNIFDTLSNLHKLQYLTSAQQAWNYAESYYGDSFYNGKGDAFRHAFFNALSTVRLGSDLTKRLTDAHETKPSDDPNYTNFYKEKQMDLFNNAVGIETAYGSGRLYQLIEQALINGDLRYLSHLLGGGSRGRATDLSELTPTNQ